jgi:hypothetical protein
MTRIRLPTTWNGMCVPWCDVCIHRASHRNSPPLSRFRYLFNEAQCMPAYVLTIEAFEDTRTDSDDKTFKG